MRRVLFAAVLLLTVVGIGVAIEAQWLDVQKFAGIQQQVPSNACPPESCRTMTNVDVRKVGAIQRIPAQVTLSTPSSWGTHTNVTRTFATDPLGLDISRAMWMACNATAPTTGQAGQHIFAAGLEDTGSGITVGQSLVWRQVDSPWELAYDTSSLDGFVGHTKYQGLGFMSCDQGILEVGGAQGEVGATASACMTAAWLGSPARPSAAGTASAGNPNGTYKYRVTFVSALGESMPSKPSAQVTVASKHITLTLPTGPKELGSPSDHVVARNIYRTKGGAVSLTNAGFESPITAGTWSLQGTGATTALTSDSTTVLQDCDSAGTAPDNIVYGEALYPCSLEAGTTMHTQGVGSMRGIWYSDAVGGGGTATYFSRIRDRKTAGGFALSDIDQIYCDFAVSAGGAQIVQVQAGANNNLYHTRVGPISNNTFYAIGGGGDTCAVPASWRPTAVIDVTTPFSAYAYTNTYFTPTGYSYLDNIRAVRDGAFEGTYGLKLTRNGNDCWMEQTFTAVTGQTYTFECYALSWGYDATAVVDCGIYDNSGGTAAWHDGTKADTSVWGWQRIYSTWTCTGTTGCKVRVRLSGRDGWARFDACGLSAGTGGLGGYYFLGTVSDNSTTTYDDNIADTALTVAEDTSARWYVPPGPWIEAHNDRMWSCGATGPVTQRNALYYSDIGVVECWPPGNIIDSFNGNDGDPVTGLKSWRGSLYVFKRGSIWRVRGFDESDFEVAKILDGVGCVDGRTICSNDRGIMFFGGKTFWIFDGAQATDVGKQVKSFIDTVYFDSNNDEYQMGAEANAGEFWFGLKNAAVAYPAFWLAFDAAEGRWTRVVWSAQPSHVLWPRTRSEWQLGVAANGAVMRLDSAGHDNNTEMAWVTPSYEFGDPVSYKTVDSVHVSVEAAYSATGAYQVKLYPDATDHQIDTSIEPAYAVKTFDITTGPNQLDWYLTSDDLVIAAGGNRFKRLAIGLFESSQATYTPVWSWPAQIDYTCEVEPPLDANPWTLTGVDHATASGGSLVLSSMGTDVSYYSRTPTAIGVGQSLWYYIKQRISANPQDSTSISICRIYTGVYMLRLFYSTTTGALYDNKVGAVLPTGLNLLADHEFVVRVKYDGTATCWVDGVLLFERALATTTTNRIDFGKMSATNEPATLTIDRVAYTIRTDANDATAYRSTIPPPCVTGLTVQYRPERRIP